MSSGPNWLYSFAHFGGAALALAVYVAGLVVTLLRWHLGTAARLGAIGFGLLAFNALVVQTASVVIWYFGSAEPDDVISRAAILSSVSAIFIAVGHVLLVLSLRAALRDSERIRNALPRGVGVAPSPGGAERR